MMAAVGVDMIAEHEPRWRRAAHDRSAADRSCCGPSGSRGSRSSACSCSRSLLFNLVVDDYLSARFVSRLLIAISITALLAAGEALVIITRNIDLSVGSIVGVAAYLTAELLADHPGLPAVVAVAFAVGIGAVLGLVNGVLVAVAKVPSIIVTLGTLSIYRSVLTSHAGGETIPTGALPAWIVDLPRSTVFTHRAVRGAHDVRHRRSSSPSPCTSCCSTCAPGGTCTPSARTRRPPARPVSTTGASRSPPSSRAARWPGSPGSCTSAGSARSTSPPGPASSWPRSPPPSSAASARSAARAPSSAPSSAPC